MAKLNSLKPRIGTLNTQRTRTLTTETQRITGSRLQAIRDRILRRDNGLCQCDDCKAAPSPRVADIVDHRIPLWEGGPDTDENRQAMAADPCHKKKSADEAKRRASAGR
jgi:5-methylcytosine-specific restriction protein A